MDATFTGNHACAIHATGDLDHIMIGQPGDNAALRNGQGDFGWLIVESGENLEGDAGVAFALLRLVFGSLLIAGRFPGVFHVAGLAIGHAFVVQCQQGGGIITPARITGVGEESVGHSFHLLPAHLFLGPHGGEGFFGQQVIIKILIGEKAPFAHAVGAEDTEPFVEKRLVFHQFGGDVFFID